MTVYWITMETYFSGYEKFKSFITFTGLHRFLHWLRFLTRDLCQSMCIQKKEKNRIYVAGGIGTKISVIKHLTINWNLFDDNVNQLKRLSVVLISFSYNLMLFEEKLRLCNHIIGCCIPGFCYKLAWEKFLGKFINWIIGRRLCVTLQKSCRKNMFIQRITKFFFTL